MIWSSSSNRTRRRRLALSFVAASLFFGACGGSSDGNANGGSNGGGGTTTAPSGGGGGDQQPGVTGGALTVGTTFHLTDIDPTRSVSASDPTYLWTIYDSLFTFDPTDLSPQPWLVTEWEWLGDTELQLSLRDDVSFHDGEPFNAEAVKKNIERALGEGSTLAGEIGMIDTVEVVDDTTVVLNLASPNAAVLTVLSQRAGMMVSPAVIDSVESGGTFEAIGTGPFTMTTYTPEDRIVLARNENYWRADEPKLDQLTVIGIPSSGSLVSAFNGGDLDVVINLPATELPAVQTSGDLVTDVHTTQLYRKVYFNFDNEYLSDVRVRQALNYAIDREAMMAAALPDAELGQVAWMPLPSGHFAHTDSLENAYPYDPERAKELLAEAGYPDGFELDMLVETVPANQQRAEMIEQFWAAIGVTTNMSVMETIAAAELFMAGDGSMFNSQWGGRPDPDMTFRIGFYTGGIFVPTPWDGAEELNAAIDFAAAQPTIEERSAAYEEVNRIIIENALDLPLFFEPTVWGRTSEVTGLNYLSTNTAKFHTLAMAEG